MARMVCKCEPAEGGELGNSLRELRAFQDHLSYMAEQKFKESPNITTEDFVESLVRIAVSVAKKNNIGFRDFIPYEYLN